MIFGDTGVIHLLHYPSMKYNEKNYHYSPDHFLMRSKTDRKHFCWCKEWDLKQNQTYHRFRCEQRAWWPACDRIRSGQSRYLSCKSSQTWLDERYTTLACIVRYGCSCYLKNPEWAEKVKVVAPRLSGFSWKNGTTPEDSIAIWENFNRSAIIENMFKSLDNYEKENAQ